MGKAIDLTGKKFGKLTVIKLDHIKRYVGCTKYFWLCKCECGNFCITSQNQLSRGKTKSCGCLQKEYFSIKHNLRFSKLYITWENIKKRCYNKKSSRYKWYGEKGIIVCNEWKDDFKAFYDWAMANGYKEGLTIDRIDVNGNYEPSNCRWVDWKTQQQNKNSNIYLTYNNQTKCITEWARIFNINRATLQWRIKKGWEVQEALTTLPKTKYHH